MPSKSVTRSFSKVFSTEGGEMCTDLQNTEVQPKTLTRCRTLKLPTMDLSDVVKSMSPLSSTPVSIPIIGSGTKTVRSGRVMQESNENRVRRLSMVSGRKSFFRENSSSMSLVSERQRTPLANYMSSISSIDSYEGIQLARRGSFHAGDALSREAHELIEGYKKRDASSLEFFPTGCPIEYNPLNTPKNSFNIPVSLSYPTRGRVLCSRRSDGTSRRF